MRALSLSGASLYLQGNVRSEVSKMSRDRLFSIIIQGDCRPPGTTKTELIRTKSELIRTKSEQIRTNPH